MKTKNCITATIITLLLLFSLQSLKAQNSGTILIIVNVDSKILIDGSEIAKGEAGKPFKYDATIGEHYIQAKSIEDTKREANEIVTIELNKQKVVKLEIPVSKEPENTNVDHEAISVADLGFTIPGLVGGGVNTSNSLREERPNTVYFYYAFEKGDIITIDFSMSNAKGTNMMMVSTYPDGAIKYENANFVALSDLRITVEERSIYKFSLATNFVFDRKCRMIIKRIPSSSSTIAFNPNVGRKTRFIPKEIIPLTHYFINSGSNAYFKGGKSREILEVNLPGNTVQWYYRVSAFRTQRQLDQASKEFGLLKQLTSALDKTGGLLSFGVDQLLQPPGADYCDMYLLDTSNVRPFLAKTQYNYMPEGSRQNCKSGIVKINSNYPTRCYLGMKNPDGSVGINIDVEVVAIVKDVYMEMENK